MSAAGHMAKRVQKPEGFNRNQISDVYSVSSCVHDDFTDYMDFWTPDDSPAVIRAAGRDNSLDLSGTMLFYYQLYEQECDGEKWLPFEPEPWLPIEVALPDRKKLELVTFCAGHSPLSCNARAREIPTHTHGLRNLIADAFASLNQVAFRHTEPGPYCILAVHSIDSGELS